MNSILQVKLTYTNEHNNQRPNERQLRTNSEVASEKIDSLVENLRAVLRYYRSVPKLLNNILIDVNYNDIIAKSKRIQDVLKPIGKVTNDVVVGARFSDAPEGQENHIITYYVDAATIDRTIEEMLKAKQFINRALNGVAKAANFNDQGKKLKYDGYGLSKSKLRGIIVDCSVIESFSVPSVSAVPERDTFLVTVYKTELSLSLLLEKLGVEDRFYRYSFYENDTISVTRELYDLLNDKVPYMISMISSDFAQIKLDEIEHAPDKETIDIPDPKNEPVIGVIDTFFDESAYFGK